MNQFILFAFRQPIPFETIIFSQKKTYLTDNKSFLAVIKVVLRVRLPHFMHFFSQRILSQRNMISNEHYNTAIILFIEPR